MNRQVWFKTCGIFSSPSPPSEKKKKKKENNQERMREVLFSKYEDFVAEEKLVFQVNF